MIPISAIEGLLPSIKVKSVILSDPTQVTVEDNSRTSVRNAENLDVKIKTSAITTVSGADADTIDMRDFLSIPNFKFHEHLRMAVIQSSHQQVTWFLQTLGDEILDYIGPLDDWHGNTKFDDLIYTNVVSRLGIPKDNVPSFKKSSMKVKTAKLFDNIDKPILEKIDDDGNRIESIPVDFFFTIPTKTPKHLAYFVVCYVDYDSLVSSLDIPSEDGFVNLNLNPKDFASLGTFATPLEMEVVFDEGVLSNTTYFFKTLDDKIWGGPVHKMVDNKYMTGLRHGSDSVDLVSFQTKNVKLQDFRNREGFMKVNVMNDFQDEQAALVAAIKGFAPKDKSLNPLLNSIHPYVSDLFLSVSPDQLVKFMFMINMDDLFATNSVFGKVVKTERRSLRREITSRSSIKSIKIYRHIVKEGIGSNRVGDPVKSYIKQNEAPVLVASTSQPANFATIDRTTNISEEAKMSYEIAGVRSFNVVDRNFTEGNSGQYQYRVELEVFDGTVDYFREQLFKLSRFATVLKNFESDMLNSIVRPEEHRDNPHILDSHVVLSRTREVGGYDSRFENLTPNFAILMGEKYAAELRTGINEFLKIMKIFMHDKKFDVGTERKVTNFLGLITNVNTVNPTSITTILQIVYTAINKISSFIGEDVQLTDPHIRKSENILGRSNSSAERRVITINKTFHTVADLSPFTTGGYDYLSLNNRESMQGQATGIGLKFINGRRYRRRVQAETLRYFTSTTPDIGRGMTAGTPPQQWAGQASAINSSLSFFAPAIVKLDGMIDLLSADRIQDNPTVSRVITRIAANMAIKEGSNRTPRYQPKFMSQLRNAGQSSGEASSDQISYFAKNYNFSPTPAETLVPLTDAQHLGPAPPLSQEDDPMSLADFYTATSAPQAVYETLFRRQTSRPQGMGFNTPSQEEDISLFNMDGTANYLQTAPRGAIAQLPNQIKALFMTATGNLSEVKSRPFLKPNVFQDPAQSAAATMQYKMLMQVEFLAGFGVSKLGSRGVPLMSAPQWTLLTAGAFSRMTGKKILCRLRKFEISPWGLSRPEELSLPVYDEYFILQPDVPLVSPQEAGSEEESILDSMEDIVVPPGFGELESIYANMKEFGRSARPMRVYNLRSKKFKATISKLRSMKKTINSDFVADAFNVNRIAIDAEGRRMFVGGSTLSKKSSIFNRISSSKKSTINPSLLRSAETAKASATELSSNFQSFESVGDLPQLRDKLVKMRTQLNILNQRKKNVTARLESFNDKRGIEHKNLKNMPLGQKHKKSRDALLQRISRWDIKIDALKRQSARNKKETMELEQKERDTVAAIKKEMRSMQKKIIKGRGMPTAGSSAKQTSKTKNPYTSTKNLQASYDMDLDKMAANEVFVSSRDIEKLCKYESYMSDSVSQEYNSLIKELKNYSKGEGFSRNMVETDSRVVGSVSSIVDRSRPPTWNLPPQDLLKGIERKDFDYKFVLNEVAAIRETLKQTGTPDAYIKHASIDFAKKIVSRSQLDAETAAMAVESIIKEVFSDTEDY